MRKLINSINQLKCSDIKTVIDSRMEEFKTLGNKNIDSIFRELCFCLLTANFNAARSIRIQDKIGRGFHHISEKKLAKKLKLLGHRFPNMRAKFICSAREQKDGIKKLFKENTEEIVLREWLVKNIKGLGYKEASHFLRNIGKENCAIIDFHIVDLLVAHKLIKDIKTLSREKYLEIEKLLKQLAKKTGLTLAQLDLYLWYLETGKVLK